MAACLFVVAATAAGAGPRHAHADVVPTQASQAAPVAPPVPSLLPPPETTVVGPERIEGGQHVRLEGQNGVVHVWWPADYDPATAGVVVYLHGHGSSADQSWSEFRLASQFKQSWENALFIVPDSTADGEEELHWLSLGALLRYVERFAGQARPAGPLVVVGHSGAFRNMAAWLGDIQIDELVLLDALYSHEPEFAAWVQASPRGKQRRLTLVSRDTQRNANVFVRGLDGVARLEEVPADIADLTDDERTAPVLELRSQFDHMGIVTTGKVIPVVLGRTRLVTVATAPPPKVVAARDGERRELRGERPRRKAPPARTARKKVAPEVKPR